MEKLISYNKEHCILPHLKKLNSRLHQYQIYGLSYPIKLVGMDHHTYLFHHKENRFMYDKSLDRKYKEALKHLSYNSEYHIRCSQLNITENMLTLETEWTDFASFLTTNKTLSEKEVIELESYTPTMLSNELAVVINLIVEEGEHTYLFLTKRSKHLKNFPNCMSTGASGAMGGSVKWTDFNSHGQPSPLLTAQREIYEELGINIPLENLSIRGLALQTRDKQLIFLVDANIKKDKQEVIQGMKNADDYNEIEEGHYFFVELDPAAIIPYLRYLEWSPISAVAVWELLKSRFGVIEMHNDKD
ncbi:NUDIX domain-containing protein [Bacillus sp. 31A1R]|uniref:NUDIX domain-containing protein n=1 Tax=Robertmurraya mangrovi TaxID=3098077 RepID=A0ABU5IXM4_9BACI|nr:NUDIX domain-containing protein [Bacillus sp. 31A1R]MDZ5471902.1 NUDIX domain-containing protein [Bacillus sp. 31A1R]